MRLKLPLLALLTVLLLPARSIALDMPEFGSIVLKPNPTRSDVVKYLKDLEQAKKAYARELTEPDIGTANNAVDATLAKLNEIPTEFIELIIDRTPERRGFINFQRAYLYSVIMRTDLTAKHAEIVGQHLSEYPELIQVILRYHWELLLEKTIIKAVKSNSSDGILTQYAQALARINSPDSTKLLPELLTRGNAMVMTDSYHVAQMLAPDGIDWPKTVAKAWQNAKEDPEYTYMYAPIAASYGIAEAMVVMAKKLNAYPVDQSAQIKFSRGVMRRTLLQLLDVQSASEQELVQYVLDNRDRLTFDPEAGVYIVK